VFRRRLHYCYSGPSTIAISSAVKLEIDNWNGCFSGFNRLIRNANKSPPRPMRVNGTMKSSIEVKTEVARQYDSEVQIYEMRRFRGLGGEFFDRLEKQHALSWLKRCSVLQIGTATGRFAEFLPTKGFDYFGIEISKNMALCAAGRNTGKGEVIQGDGENLPFRELSFENVLSVRSFHFLPDPERFLKEAFSVLMPGGRLVISFEILVDLSILLQRMHLMPKPFPSRTYHRIRSVVKLLERNGFVVIGTGKVTKLPLNISKRLPNSLGRLFIRFHPFLPSWFGTIGTVIGEKPVPT